jgi:protein-tyrosine phosphatase
LVDIHSHILPGLDDGPATLEESLAMLRLAAQSGTTDIVATPHSNLRFSFDFDTIQRRAEELRLAAGPAIRIFTGCDFHLTPENIERALACPSLYTINQKSYLLVELSDALLPRALPDIFDRLRAAGITPVLTHPERHPHVQQAPGGLRALVDSGGLIQVTAQSFLGRFGGSAAQAARDLLRAGLVHFVASDAHDSRDRTPALQQAFAFVARRFGASCAQSLFRENPRAALEGSPIQPDSARPSRRRWWFAG